MPILGRSLSETNSVERCAVRPEPEAHGYGNNNNYFICPFCCSDAGRITF